MAAYKTRLINLVIKFVLRKKTYIFCYQRSDNTFCKHHSNR